MNHYHLQLMGLCISLRSQSELQITPKAAPFMTEATPWHPDCRWVMESCESIAVPKGLSSQSGMRRYGWENNDYLICHYQMEGQTPFALVRHTAQGDVHLCYRRDHAHLFLTMDAVFRYIGMEAFLMRHGALLLHAAVISSQGRGILFAAPSGTGKSTQAQLWQQYKGAAVINGDRAVLCRQNGRWHVWGSPNAGTSGVYRNESAQVAAIVTLSKGPANQIRCLRGAEALARLYPELSIHRWDRRFTDDALALLEDLIRNVPVYHLDCLPDAGAVELLCQTLQ